ncbi:tripartite tricarboxylate transporter substrate binding protein [Chloroflexus sp.]|uniref:Bug family tripartite tricarboxylate transporter substrate binding protein n=1 Tax=Chloroflexus sp. TaxID=1904827 RepID=UPI002ACD5FD3|nr:tripartite tricarboxylate transporter substrate binding protein [Chloroflexus sp.]
MQRVFPTLIFIAVLLSACANQTTTTTEQFPTQPINIMAPASPGGGWDSTARAMQTALAATTGQTVQVYNVSGAGGTIGLAQFVNEAKGKPHELMVGGLVMVGAIQTNKAPVNLSQVTPLALLTAEAEAIVVPADSKYQTLQELIADFKANPSAISWGGGSAGGTDHILVGLIAKAVGVAPGQINYIAYSGGGEATAAILSGAVTAGVSGVSEFAEQVAAGTMRMLAVSSEQRIAGLDVPTLKEAGVDVALMNWRAVFGAPELTAAQRAAIIAALEKMHASKEWQDALKNNGWTDFFRTGDEFSTFLNNEITRIGTVLRDLGLVQ